MKILGLFLLLICRPLFASPTITQGPYVTGISRSSAVISWATDIASDTQIRWGYSSGSLAASACPTGAPTCYSVQGSAQTSLLHMWYVSGAAGGTTIYYQVCSGVTCSSTTTFQTLDPAAIIPADPIPPTPVDAPVTPTGTLWTVGADCNDVSTGLVARWTSAAPGDIVEIDPAITPYCAGNYVYPVKTGPPYILTRVKNASTTFPGKRRAGPADKPKMARFIQNGLNIAKVGSDPTATPCYYQSYSFWQGQSPNFAIYRCLSISPKAIASATASGDLVLTVTGHGYTNGFVVHVSGATGAGASVLNGDFTAKVLDADTIGLYNPADASNFSQVTPITSGGATTGGTIRMDQATIITASPFMGAVPSTCTWGTWYQKTDAGDEFHAPYYCNNTNELVQYRVDATSGPSPWPVIDLTTNNANYAMFQGLSFEPLNLKGDGAGPQYMYQGATTAYGLTSIAMVAQGVETQHIYWDNILAGCPDPSPIGVYVKCLGWAIDMSGTQFHIGGSYFSGFQSFESTNANYDGNSWVLVLYHVGPHEIVNNYFACSGICVFYPDDDASTSTATDLTFKQNTIETPDKYWDMSPDWLGAGLDMHWTQRHRFEQKRLRRGIIDGNRFIGGWVWNNNASGICLCTRGGAIGAQVQSVDSGGTYSLITTYPAGPNAIGYPLNGLQAGDQVAFTALGAGCTSSVGQWFTVHDVPSLYSVNLDPNMGCTASSGNMISSNARNNYVSDQLVQNNTWLNNPTDHYALGHDSQVLGVSHIMSRVKFTNNLSNGLNGNRVGAITTGAVGGTHLNTLVGFEDVQYLHHTVVNMVNQSVFGSAFYANSSNQDGYRANTSSGLNLSNSIFPDLNPLTIGMWWVFGSFYGQAALDNSFFGTTPPYTAANNVILRANGSSGVTYPYTPETNFFNTSTGTFPFFSTTNWRVKTCTAFTGLSCTTPGIYNSGGSQNATDGLAVGANIDAIEAAQGNVSNARAFGIGSTTATVGFLAPDATGCTVDWDTVSPAGTSHRTANAGGSRVQSVALSGLPAHSTVYYRVNCAVQQPVGSFATP